MYKCGHGDPEEVHLIYYDDDHYIKTFPKFRFGKGCNVTFSTELAIGLPARQRDPWLHGKVSNRNMLGKEYYAAYEVTFMENNKKHTCYIVKDDDAHIAPADSSPRERLMDSIEHGCSYEHICYLIASSGMDVVSFCDLLVNHAIGFASYDALLWLQKDGGVDLSGICDADGNGLLHQLLKSDHVERFMQTASERIKTDSLSRRIDFGRRYSDSEQRNLFRHKNKKGRLWLHDIVISGNRRVLDLALSPCDGFFWVLLQRLRSQQLSEDHSCGLGVTRDNSGFDLKDTARLLGHYDMEKMIDQFTTFSLLHDLSYRLDWKYLSIIWGDDICPEDSCVGVPSSEILCQFTDPAFSVARRLIRFSHDFERYQRNIHSFTTIETLLDLMAESSYVSGLSWLINTDPSLLNPEPIEVMLTGANRDEFAQPEMYTETGQTDHVMYLSMVSRVVVGYVSFQEDIYFDARTFRHRYSRFLRRYATVEAFKESPLYEVLQKLISMLQDDEDDDFYCSLRYKHRLLQDDEFLERRLKGLDFLIIDKKKRPPNVLDVIHWRQCGVLDGLLLIRSSI